MRYNLDNPSIVKKENKHSSLEKEQFKMQSLFNSLLKRNLKKINRECREERKSVNIICIGERIFY